MAIGNVAAAASDRRLSQRAFRFVLLIGILSFFADFTYEGSRSIIGPYLAYLGASAAVVGVVTGFGEFLGYALRLASGRAADTTGMYWPITIFGYVLQMSVVPALALTGSWPTAAVLIILERVGRAIRNPPRDVMLSHAAKRVGGYGWVFGIHEALDQFGAMWQTPMEFMRSVLAKLPLPAPPVSELTGLFEIARFSRRPVGTAEREAAWHALTEIRAKLEEEAEVRRAALS